MIVLIPYRARVWFPLSFSRAAQGQHEIASSRFSRACFAGSVAWRSWSIWDNRILARRTCACCIVNPVGTFDRSFGNDNSSPCGEIGNVAAADLDDFQRIRSSRWDTWRRRTRSPGQSRRVPAANASRRVDDSWTLCRIGNHNGIRERAKVQILGERNWYDFVTWTFW